MIRWFKHNDINAAYSPSRDIWKRFSVNRWALISLILLIVCILIALAGYYITPDKTQDGNRIIPALALKKPLTHSLLFQLPVEQIHQRTPWYQGDKQVYQYLVLNGYKVTSDTLFLNVYLGEGLQDTIIKYHINQLRLKGINNVTACIQNRVHYLGTDNLGRDILTRLILGLRISLSVGLVAVFISLTIGIFVGSVSGYYGGAVDKIIQWFMSIIWAIPTVLLVFALTILLGKGFWQIFLALGLTIWVGVARLIRGQVMSVKQEQYIEAARSIGYNDFRIIFRHILPNILGPILVIAASNFATAILLEAGLSFLGIGIQPPAPSWGSMIRDNYGYIVSDMPYMALVPGFAIMFLVLLLNLIGNGLRDALDIKTKHQ